MTASTRPYLIRAIYEWTLDSGLTPYLLVDATAPGACVPEQYVDKGKIILNIAPQAVQGLKLGNDQV
ncbi:MAG TPA: ClpXP protease specificity-enhancing factor, partial [Gammaproteobacteria bacterium]|nr:ClpXP protease specificity-enhancing factor [Gammaproteobacteria bacterium]